MTKLTVNKLKEMLPEEIFATGTGTYPELFSQEIRWVAVRGGGMHDWAIYYHLSEHPVESVARSGDKCFTKEIIKRLVPCNEEALKLYRR